MDSGMNDSGMNYGKMAALVSDSGPIAEFKKHVKEYFDYVENELRPSIERVYGGAAAQTYITSLRNTSNELQGVLDDMINKLKTKAEENEAAYKQQESKLQNSASV